MPLYNADNKPLAAGSSTVDWKHAKKLFLDSGLVWADGTNYGYRLAPKQSFLYYVCININQNIISGVFGTGISSQGLSDQYETGMLVKSVELPKFTLDTKVMNAYNRKTIVQNKINYDPVSLTFHDDAANVVLNFWNDYYTYYYRDSDYETALYRSPSTYDLRQRTKWGFSPLNSSLVPFIRDIQIYSLNQKRFTEYTLINPMITSWRHGEHRATESAGIMECAMTLSYETVKYRTGFVNPVDVNGFALLDYDSTSSPISTSTTNIYSDQDLIGVLGSAAQDLSRPDGSFTGTDLVSNYLSVQRAYENLKSVNWGTVAQKTLSQIGVNIVGGAINGAANGIVVPYSTSYGNGSYGITAQNLVNLSGVPAGAVSTAGGSVASGVNSLYSLPNTAASAVVSTYNNAIGTVIGGVTGVVNTIVAAPINYVNGLINDAATATLGYITGSIIDPFAKSLDSFLKNTVTGWIARPGAIAALEAYDVSDATIVADTFGDTVGQYTATAANGETMTIWFDTDLNRYTPGNDGQYYD